MITKRIGFFRQAPLDMSPEVAAEKLILIEERVKKSEDFWRRQSKGHWDLRYKAFMMPGVESCHPPLYAQNDVAKVDTGSFNPNYFYVMGGSSGGYCGQANLGGNRGATYLNISCNEKVDSHEGGHMFGVGHASKKSLDGNISEYGDFSSTMSTTTVLTGLTSVELCRLGLVTDRQILNITKTQQILLAPTELNPAALHDNEYQHAIIEKGGKRLQLSIRKKKGAHYPSGVAPEETLYIHEYDKNKQERDSILYTPTLKPGDTVTLDTGITVDYIEYDNETARIDVYYNEGDAEPDNLEMPIGLPAGSSGVSDLYTGVWHDPEFTGEGIDLHTKGQGFAFIWFTYNHKQTSRRFYLGSGSGSDEFSIYTTENGTFEDPAKRIEIKVGTGKFSFEDDIGVFLFNLDELGRGAINLIRAAKSEKNEYDGIFHDPNRVGEGFSLRLFDNFCAAYWYTYGPITESTNPYSGYAGNQKQRWFLGTGYVQDNGTYKLNVHEATNNIWNGYRDSPSLLNVGEAAITFLDENNILFDFDINAQRIESRGSFMAGRIF